MRTSPPTTRATVLFEAPTRLAATLRDVAAACGAERAAEVCRELTKLHEQIARGTLAELVAAVGDGTIPARGEVVLVIAGRAADAAADAEPAMPIEKARAQVAALVRAGSSRTDAARQVAAATGHSRRDLYRAAGRD